MNMGDRIGRATMQTRYLVTVDEIGMSGVEYMYTRDKIGRSLVVGSTPLATGLFKECRDIYPN